MRRIVHGGQAVTPGAFAVLEVERLQAGMLVLGLAVVDLAELALLVELPHGDRRLLVVAGLGHHVGQAGGLDGVEQTLGLLDPAAQRGRHGGDRVLAMLHHLGDVLDVIGRLGEDRHGVDVLIQHQFFERLVRLGALVDLHEPFAALGPQVADRLDDAVGVLVPLEIRAEPAADDADPDLLRRRVDRQGGIQRHRRARDNRASLEELPPRAVAALLRGRNLRCSHGSSPVTVGIFVPLSTTLLPRTQRSIR